MELAVARLGLGMLASDIAEQMGRQQALRIVTLQALLVVEARQVELMFGEARERILIDVTPDDERTRDLVRQVTRDVTDRERRLSPEDLLGPSDGIGNFGRRAAPALLGERLGVENDGRRWHVAG